MSTVMVFGTFDILHEGHSDFFRQAREYGDRLVVIIARDKTVKEVKGRAPRRDEDLRLAQVREHPLVDMALLGRLGDKYRLIDEIQPDFVCLGYDQESFTENLQERLHNRGLETKVVRLSAYKPEVYKSSLLET